MIEKKLWQSEGLAPKVLKSTDSGASDDASLLSAAKVHHEQYARAIYEPMTDTSGDGTVSNFSAEFKPNEGVFRKALSLKLFRQRALPWKRRDATLLRYPA